MILGLISDAHGNIYGLKKCVEALEKRNVDAIYFLGDAVGYFSKSKEVLAFLKEKAIFCLRGNHEDMVLKDTKLTDDAAEICNIEYTKSALEDEDYRQISSWTLYHEMNIDNLNVLMVHGGPNDYLCEYVYYCDDLTQYDKLDYQYMFMGHTHMPFIAKMKNKTIVNVGSVGFCRDKGRFLHYVLFDTEKEEVEIFQVDFPFDKVDELMPFHDSIKEVLNR